MYSFRLFLAGQESKRFVKLQMFSVVEFGFGVGEEGGDLSGFNRNYTAFHKKRTRSYAVLHGDAGYGVELSKTEWSDEEQKIEIN